MVTELKIPQPASARCVRDILINALESVNKEAALAVCVCISTEDSVTIDWDVIPGGSYSDLVCGIERLKKQIIEEMEEG